MPDTRRFNFRDVVALRSSSHQESFWEILAHETIDGVHVVAMRTIAAKRDGVGGSGVTIVKADQLRHLLTEEVESLLAAHKISFEK